MKVAFISMFLSATALLAVTQMMFKQLAKELPDVYDRIGRPHLIMTNNIIVVVNFWKWIYRKNAISGTETLYLRALFWTLRLVTPIYLMAFFLIALSSWSDGKI